MCIRDRVYDPQQDTFDVLSLYQCEHFSLAAANSQLVLVGGRNVQTGKRTNTLGVWNSGQWTQPFLPMNTGCQSPAVGNHNNRWLVVVGGRGDGGDELSKVEILDTASGQWYCGAPLPQPCYHVSLATVGNTCYLLGLSLIHI